MKGSNGVGTGSIGRRGLALGAFGAVLGAALGPRAARAAEFTLRLSTWGAPNVPQVADFVPVFTKAVQDGSGGRVAVQHYPAGSLVKETDVGTAIQARVVDISLSDMGVWASSVPTASALNTVLFHPTDEGFASVLGFGTPLYKRLAEDLAKRNAVLLGTIDNGAPVVVSKDKIATPEDFRGKTVRSYDRLTSQIVQTLGGAPSSIQVSDVYPALERGTVKAAIGGLQGAVGLKEYEVAKYLLVTNGVFGTAATFYVMNKQAMAALPADLQQLVLKAGEEASKAANDSVVKAMVRLRDEMRAHGMVVTELEPGKPDYEAFRLVLEPLAKQQAARLPADLLAELVRAGP